MTSRRCALANGIIVIRLWDDQQLLLGRHGHYHPSIAKAQGKWAFPAFACFHQLSGIAVADLPMLLPEKDRHET
jgi:hypothetical protein